MVTAKPDMKKGLLLFKDSCANLTAGWVLVETHSFCFVRCTKSSPASWFKGSGKRWIDSIDSIFGIRREILHMQR